MTPPKPKLYAIAPAGTTALKLVPVHVSFAEKIAEWAADQGNGEYFRRYAPTFAMQFNFTDPHNWIVLADGKAIGLATLTDFDTQNRRVAMGLLLEHPFRTSEVIANTCHELARYAFEYLGYNKLYCLTLPHRTALHARLEAAGFIREATLQQNCFWRGRFWDEVSHALFMDTYKERYVK